MKIVLAGLLVLSLTGCAWLEPIETSTVSVDKAPLILPVIDRLSLREIEWIVITPETYAEIQKGFKGSSALIAVTPRGYESISLNANDIMLLVKQQRAVISAYKKYYATEYNKPQVTEEVKAETEEKPKSTRVRSSDKIRDIPDIE
ncbi:MAG: hypothetical protein DRI24_22810 [Deltaproteobacteria bacterium]|nr:MAG: hypothetical protein DRI24_22810 [Deltaproteobacteria bacterium]